jgi:aspartyl-tRNA(Asn)/glutamyl-tRNA(Gln) amidotransferase subunit A
MSEDLCFTPASTLVEAYRSRRLSPVEVATAVLDRIDALNPRLNCFCHLDRATTLDAARASEARWARGQPCGLADGVPVSIKDLLPVAGWPTRMGSRAIEAPGPWTEDDPAVARLREHGAVLLGKTTTPEFGDSGVTNSPLTGLTVNPWDLGRTTGGSSGGSAAAVAAGLGPLSVGTDAGGSIRTPSSFCGLVGLKPTFGRVAQTAGADWGGLSVSGPMARTAMDAALAMCVIARPDVRDWNSLPPSAVDYRAELEKGIEGLRVAYSPDLDFMPVNAEVAAVVACAVEGFAALGAEVTEASPDLGDPVSYFDVLWSPLIARFAESLGEARQKLLGDETKETLAVARKITLPQYLDAYAKRAELAAVMARFHERYDVLVTPMAIVTPFHNEHHMPPEWDTERAWLWELPAFCFNFTRQPAVAVPCGFSESGLPVGLQIVAPVYEDARALRAAHAFQSAYPTLDRRPPLK